MPFRKVAQYPRRHSLRSVYACVGACAIGPLSVQGIERYGSAIVTGWTHKISDSGVFEFSVPSAWLISGGRLNLALVQSAPPSVDQIINDESREENVAAIEDLLSGANQNCQSPAIEQLVTGRDPVLIGLPEYAFSSKDFQAVDAAVRACKQPVILIAGFGAAKGKAVLDLVAASDGTCKRLLAWDQTSQPIAPSRPVNGGWCWVHRPGEETVCITFLKNHLEQSTEVSSLGGMQEGKTLLRLRFNDFDLVAMICADMVQPLAAGGGAAVARIKKELESSPETKPILIFGSLLQADQNDNWSVAIDQWLNVATLGRPALVAIANVASGKLSVCEKIDKWRSMTGVYQRLSDVPRNQKHLRSARALDGHNTKGAVVRRTTPCIVSGPISWPPYNPTGEMFYWRADMSCPTSKNGICVPITSPPAIADTEFGRFVDRQRGRPDLPQPLAKSLRLMSVDLENSKGPAASLLFSTLLGGIDAARQAHDPDEICDGDTEIALRHGLCSLATLRYSGSLAWGGGDQEVGQLKKTGGPNILVWRDPKKSATSIGTSLAAWTMGLGPHPDLVAIVEGPNGAPPAGTIVPERHVNFAAPPGHSVDLGLKGSLESASSDFTEPHISRRVTCIPLQEVRSFGLDDQLTDELWVERLDAFVEKI